MGSVAFDLDYVREIKDKMKGHDFMFCYRGNFSQQITKSILSITEKKLDTDKVDVPIKKKIFKVMVECLQSICNRSKEQAHLRSSLIMIGKDNFRYVVYSGNVISNDYVADLKDKINSINVMSKEDLKKKHIELIRSANVLELGETGIGLIDIAIKSGNKLVFDFLRIDEQHSYFVLRTSVDSF